MVGIIMLLGMVLLTVLYICISDKKQPLDEVEFENDFTQIKLKIEESLSMDELGDCNYGIDVFFRSHARNRKCLDYVLVLEKLADKKYSELLLNELKLPINIYEPSK